MPKQLDSYWKYVEPLFKTVDTGDPESFLSTSATVPRSELLLFAAHFSLSEVHNGGLLQFFWNSTGVLAPEALEGFLAIGMEATAAVLECAIAKLGSPYPRDRDSRWDELLAASGKGEEELTRIFKQKENFYLAFQEATEPLGFTVMTEELWKLAETEKGGFQQAATRYAQTFEHGC